MRGLVLVATEGINGTVCGTPDVITKWKAIVSKDFPGIDWKDSGAESLVFPRWFVKIRTRIVGLDAKELKPSTDHNHLSPEEWNRVMEEEDTVILDARNFYETKIGMFEGAVDPKIRTFDEFRDFAKTTDLPKTKKVLMYCTGGIRCERAILEMEKQGFQHVYQLQGGILAYLKQFPNVKFKGECFVFDRRVAVDQNLHPSEHFSTCPHCGNPGDIDLSCLNCKSDAVVCDDCHKEEVKRTCTKNCRYRLMQIWEKKKKMKMA